MVQIIPRPAGAETVPCPSCGHPINQHYVNNMGGCSSDEHGTPCWWTANDIAWWLLHGTTIDVPPGAVQESPLRSLGNG